MPTIHLTTFVKAPPARVFDLSRSIEVHKKSMSHTGEEAVAGTRMGLINLDETVTWKAKHLGKQRLLKSKITTMKKNEAFTDEMLEGDFRSMRHEHHFKPIENGTLMIDYFNYEMPFGLVGKMIDRFYLRKYMTRLLETRNEHIRQLAESEQWKRFLD
ncbi:MAG TPA: SRPBCC family protein [Flavihumibacter sp.]|nr:SRPBCC family protein [Bacteroidota bacterium]HOA36893.1 SRPBCC family protein [Flavihumibacter sp.]HPZ87551.1 SRPBCC family protein [Flavihumibacter sp.]HQD08170.1 SRPBCC family protein [Flavihumibacter sp.]